MHIDEGSGWFSASRGERRACHGVPLIADPAGVEYEREFIIHRMSGRRGGVSMNLAPPIRMEEARVSNTNAGEPRSVTVRDGPLQR